MIARCHDDQWIRRERERLDLKFVIGCLTHDIQVVLIPVHTFDDTFTIRDLERKIDARIKAAELTQNFRRQIFRRGDHPHTQASDLKTL